MPQGIAEGMTGGLALRLRGIVKDYAGEKALKGVDLSIAPGSLFGIIGADGAGKSTLLTILATLLDPDAGEASMLGLDIRKNFRTLRREIAFMPQRFSLYPDLTVSENLDFFADVYALDAAEKVDRKAELLRFSGLEPFQQRRAGQLSGGMKQKLALSCCLLHKPRLLLLDEPTVGVDPVARRDFWIMLRSLKAQGITLVVTTPYMDEAAQCEALLLLHQGKMLATGTPVEMLGKYPYRLYRVFAATPLSFSARSPLPAQVALAYPHGGALHVAFDLNATPEADWWRFFPGAEGAEPLAPDIEDLLFALLDREPEL